MASIAAAPLNSTPQFWEDVESNGQVTPLSADLSRRLVTSFPVIEKYVTAYIGKPPGQIVDLGAGIGKNSIPLVENGGHITVIDCSKQLLRRLHSIYQSINLPGHKIKTVHGDITQMVRYGEGFDLVLAIDILPLLAPTSLQAVMGKINRCLKMEGIFIGTIVTKNAREPQMDNFMKRLGIHLYDGGEGFVRRLLKASGFAISKIEARCIDLGGGFRFEAIKASNLK